MFELADIFVFTPVSLPDATPKGSVCPPRTEAGLFTRHADV